ncbi:MAG: bifunctional phosphoribosylaminoimidazolecarboxamide formyltransferase/IMP cyclohydrolase [Nevskiaceae bacterium]|jgi:phosphoribosylaminoimidazolecarboxamide formyltransferase/IMP cyclohydrolase|nr:bifunctional phosphoribosylaminoimidazolecarboxamide formyltransferase/IMP cyclohydrolase [Nevskiaceae bacterium]
MTTGARTIRRALLSVSDKSRLLELARALQQRGVELLSTGGTARALSEAGLAVREVADVTGFPEIMDGRVKTLHPKIHGGLLGRRGVDEAVMQREGIEPIDLLVVNLYPFARTIAKPGVTYSEAIENIDVGGPAMLRGAAKNHADVAVVVDPADYDELLTQLQSGDGTTDFAFRAKLAAKAFAHTAAYDALVSNYLTHTLAGAGTGAEQQDDAFAPNLAIAATRVATLRYGENPHQRAAFYRLPDAAQDSIAAARSVQGKELSFNNIADADTALECVRQFEYAACVIVKHANPCGVATAPALSAAYELAYRTDPTSAFGGIIAFNRPLDADTARMILERQFVEVLIAPELLEGAAQALAAKPNVRVLLTGSLQGAREGQELRSVNGGLLLQDRDIGQLDPTRLRCVTKREPTQGEARDLAFAWRVAKFVKSNAIVFARDEATVGVGAGQMSRVYSSRIGAIKAADAGLEVRGAVMASDAFFPFRDGIDVAAEQGVVAVIQPGGSMRDAEVIEAANEHGMAMLFTGMRHFRH